MTRTLECEQGAGVPRLYKSGTLPEGDVLRGLRRILRVATRCMADRLLLPTASRNWSGKALPNFGIFTTSAAKGASMVGVLIPNGQRDGDLVRGLTWAPLSAVYSSPVDRAVATASPLADDHGLDIRVRPALSDPDGETRDAVQRRVVEEVLMLARTHQGETIAIVTDDELIRCLLTAFDGLCVDEMDSVAISPSHVSAIGITSSGIGRVLGVNISAAEVAV
jgi:hypothetical protein